MKKCLIISNQNIYDLININGLINYLSYKYDLVHLLVTSKNMNSSNIIFKNITNLILIENNDFNNINSTYIDNEIINLGSYNKNCIKDFSVNNLSINYFEYFYNQLELSYELKYKYEYLERDFYEENKYYEKVKKLFKDGYIFYYNKNKNFVINDKKYVYNPIYNYYEDDINNKNKWIDIKYNNIFNLLSIIEGAEEIHIFDLDIYSLMPYLNLKKVKNKYIYFNNILLKNYHKNVDDFNFIYYSN